MSAKTIFPGGNTQFLPALAGLPNTTPVPISVSTLTASGNIKCAASSDAGDTTFNTAGLTITRNITGGSAEFDFVAINSTSTVGMNFYVSETEVEGSVSTPILSMATSGVQTVGNFTNSNIGGNIDIGIIGDVGTTTFDADSTLTITRNLTNGDNEFDFIAINSTTGVGMNFYTSTTEATSGTVPILSVLDTGIKTTLCTASEGFVSTGGNNVLNTYEDSTFAITRNISDGNNEWGIVAINDTDPNVCLNIFAGNGTTEINNGTTPMLSIGVSGVSMTGEVAITSLNDAGTSKFTTANTLSIAQNVSGGSAEIDFVAITPTTTTGMNFYVSQTEIEGSVSEPALSLTTTGATVNGLLDVPGDNGSVNIGIMGDVGETTYNTAGTLTITRNLSNGDNEFDFIAINSTTGTAFRFYFGDGTTPVANDTVAALAVLGGGIKPIGIQDSTGSYGTAGQYLSAINGGGIQWITP